jgi:Zn-dependent protease
MIRFSLFGFPVAIHWMFWITCAFLSGDLQANSPEAFQRLLAFTAAALVSVLIHELGHTFTQRHFGARAHIMLYAMGGLAIPDRGFSRGQQILISLAGPFVQIAMGLLALLLVRYVQGDVLFFNSFLRAFVLISIVWGILNLVPIYPLDGGQVLWNILGPGLSKVTYWIGIVLAVGLALLALSVSQLFSTVLLGMLAYENIQRLRGDRPSNLLHPQ